MVRALVFCCLLLVSSLTHAANFCRSCASSHCVHLRHVPSKLKTNYAQPSQVIINNTYPEQITHQARGTTVYGYPTYQSYATSSKSVDVAQLLERATRLVERSQTAGQEGLTQLLESIGQLAEGQAQAQALAARAHVLERLLHGGQPQPPQKIQLEYHDGAWRLAPTTDTAATRGDDEHTQQRPAAAAAPAIQRCTKCHSGPQPQGQFALDLVPLEIDSIRKAWGRITTGEAARRMPPASEPPLSDTERAAIGAHFLQQLSEVN